MGRAGTPVYVTAGRWWRRLQADQLAEQSQARGSGGKGDQVANPANPAAAVATNKKKPPTAASIRFEDVDIVTPRGDAV